MDRLSDAVFWWTGAAICITGGWALVAILAYAALEYTLKSLRVTNMVLQWKWDKMRGRVLAKKPEPGA